MIGEVEKDLSGLPYGFQAGSNDLDLDVVWKVVQTRRWFIFTFTAIVLTISTIYSLRLPDVFTARTRILVEQMDQSAYQNPELLKPMPEHGPGIYHQTRVELLKSRHILEQAVQEVGLAKHYGVTTTRQAVRILKKSISAKLVRSTHIIELSVMDEDPEMARRTADVVAENFVRESWHERLFVSEQLLKWFPDEGEVLSKNSGIKQLKKLDEEGAIASLPSVLNNPVVSTIKQERLKVDAEIKELSKRYTNEHPKMKELLARVDYLESEKRVQIENIISGLKSGLAGEFSIANVKVVEQAEAPSSPSGPNRLFIVLPCTGLGLFFSVAFALFFYHLDQNVRTEENIRKVPLTFLGYMPEIEGVNGKSKAFKSEGLLDHICSDLRLIDDVANIRASVLFSLPAERSKLLMCTSAIPEEGKTTIVSVLGVSLAEVGEKILLVDADMRKPSLHQVFGLENKIGLTNCLVGARRCSEVVQKIEKVPGLHVITSGEKTPNPTMLLGSNALETLIRELELDYDRIIFDVPPALHIADGLILARKVHGTILIFRSGKVHQNMAKKIKEKIHSAGGAIIGGIVNRADYRRLDYAYYRYYRQYNKYYHRSNQDGKVPVGAT